MASPHIQAEQDSLNALNGSQAQIKALPRDQSQHQPQDEDQAPSIEPGLPSPSLKDHPSPHLPALAFTTSSSPPRDLPSKNRLAADNFEDAYVQFIFYCNPALSTSLSTTELRRGFNAVPRADGKSFEIFALFRLVERFERGEVGTWNALVVELGVERPDTEKGQSTQKLGQYAVRLKVGDDSFFRSFESSFQNLFWINDLRILWLLLGLNKGVSRCISRTISWV